MLRIRLAYGLGSLSLAAFACSGSTTSSGQAPAPNPKDTGTINSAIPDQSGSTPSPTPVPTPTVPMPTVPGMAMGGTTSVVGGAGAAKPAQRPDAIQGGGGAPAAGGDAGSLTAGAGGEELPDQGHAGDPNLPDPPLSPNCTALAEDWTQPIGAGSNWEIQFGDPRIDVANHRLVVTFDDFAAHTVDYQGGYYVRAEVNLQGSTVLTPYPYVAVTRLPSLRRARNGVELGGAKYGGGEVWTSDDWPGFSGIIIAGTTRVTVTTYVKAIAKALAVKVTYGGLTYRSGWVSGFTWSETNLGMLRYAGENNSRGSSASDEVYVGPLSGCQGLSDTAVQAAFEN
jgi:hypothetical protein